MIVLRLVVDPKPMNLRVADGGGRCGQLLLLVRGAFYFVWAVGTCCTKQAQRARFYSSKTFVSDRKYTCSPFPCGGRVLCKRFPFRDSIAVA